MWKENMRTYKALNIDVETYERLFRRKQHPKESMNAVIVRLLDKDVGGK